MKNLILPILFTFCLASCKKTETASCQYQAPTKIATPAEINYLQNYLTTNNTTAVQHSSGVFYKINVAGTGINPTVCSGISVRYTGRLLGGAVFDSNTSNAGVRFTLGDLIVGWQTVLPVLKEGGSITLFIPPSLAYGATDVRDNNGFIVIPANSYLQFDIELIDVL